MVTPQARPPVVQWFIRQVVVWSVLVWACALPLVLVTWPQFSTAERIAETIGVIVWTIVMVTVVARSRQRTGRTPRALRDGALALAAFSFAWAAIEPPFSLMVLYAPSIWLWSALARLLPVELRPGDLNDGAAVVTLTLICGLQAAAMTFGLGHLVTRVRTLFSVRRPAY